MKHKILSLLVLLVTAASGAWAQTETYAVKFEANGKSLTREVTLPHKFSCNYDSERDELDMIIKELYGITGFDAEVAPTATGSDKVTTGKTGKSQWIQIDAPFYGTVTVNGKYKKYVGNTAEAFDYSLKISLPVTVTWDATTNTGTFAMNDYDLVLTPIYSEATVVDYYDNETSYASLKEAFQNLKDGDYIKLDWDVTLTEDLVTPTIDGGAYFTIDFNGHTIDCTSAYIIRLNNAGDKLTFTDSSADQMGGLITYGLGAIANTKFVFDAGRYYIWGSTAEQLNTSFASNSSMDLAPGKEFINLEGGSAANDGFTLRVDYAAIELSIGAGKFATFYAEQDFKVVEGTDIGLYTIMTDGIDLANNQITTSALNGSIIGGETPVLIYNGGSDQQTVKLQATTETAASQMHASAFKGTDAGQTFEDTDMAAKDYYVLSGGSAFAPVKGKGTIAAHKCWLEFAKNNGNARSLKIVFDNGDATGVNEVIEVNEVSDDTLYDLNGRKLNAKPARKGVYIKNGQKVVK